MDSIQELTSDMFDFADDSGNEDFMDLYNNYIDTEIYDYIVSVLNSINTDWRKNIELGYNAPEFILGIIKSYEDDFEENRKEAIEVEIKSDYQNIKSSSQTNREYNLYLEYKDEIYDIIYDELGDISEEKEEAEFNLKLAKYKKEDDEKEYWIIGSKSYNKIEDQMKNL